MSCRHAAIIVLIGASACVTRTAGTQVDVVLTSPGVPTEVVDDLGRSWTIREAWVEVGAVALSPCGPAPSARLTSGGLGDPDEEGVAWLPDPDGAALPRHAGGGSDALDGRWIDLRMAGEIGAWTLSPPLSTWCGLAVTLQGPPSWGLHAVGPWEEQSGSAQYVSLDLALEEPLELDADHLDARVEVELDVVGWLSGLQVAGDAAAALPGAWSDPEIVR